MWQGHPDATNKVGKDVKPNQTNKQTHIYKNTRLHNFIEIESSLICKIMMLVIAYTTQQMLSPIEK